jgi:hypothetical protein
MKRSKIYTVIGIAILGLCFSSSSMANAEKEEQALAAAGTWLTLVDEGIYGDSWETAATYFKRAITKEKWEQMLTAVRSPLGRLVSRELISKMYTQSLPGAPDGEWRVSGYFIK